MISVVCSYKFVTAEIAQHNQTHINVTCVIHIGIPYCCSLYKSGGQSAPRKIEQGLIEMPTHQTSYHCSCTFECDDPEFNHVKSSVSNNTMFNPVTVSKCVCVCICVCVCTVCVLCVCMCVRARMCMCIYAHVRTLIMER